MPKLPRGSTILWRCLPNCRIVRVCFVRQTTLTNREIISEREVTCLHDAFSLSSRHPLLKSPKDTANQRYDCGLDDDGHVLVLKCVRGVSRLSFRCHSRRYFGRLQFVGTSQSDQRRPLCRTVRAAHSQNVHSWRKDSVLSVWQRWYVLLAKWLIQPASNNKW